MLRARISLLRFKEDTRAFYYYMAYLEGDFLGLIVLTLCVEEE